MSGLRVQGECESRALRVTLLRDSGRPIRDDEQLKVVTSDFLATGGDGVFTPVTPLGSAEPPNVALLRDAMAEQLRRRGGRLSEGQLIKSDRWRLIYPGARPVQCGP